MFAGLVVAWLAFGAIGALRHLGGGPHVAAFTAIVALLVLLTGPIGTLAERVLFPDA